MFPLPLDGGWCYQPEDKLAWLHGIFKSCIFLLGTIIGHLHDSIHLTTTTRARMHFATILMSCRFVSRVILHKKKIPKTLPCHKGILAGTRSQRTSLCKYPITLYSLLYVQPILNWELLAFFLSPVLLSFSAQSSLCSLLFWSVIWGLWEASDEDYCSGTTVTGIRASHVQPFFNRSR